VVALVGCRFPRDTSVNSADPFRERAAIEARATLVFTNAVLLKPRETLPVTDLAFTLAPLLIQEVTGAESKLNSDPATVYYQLGAVQIGGITRPQMTYLWSVGNEQQLARGIRLTLDSQGFPVVWEVLDDRVGTRVVFVSRSLEVKAHVAFGSPVPGRRFAVEQPTSGAPDVVVARVIEDGPVAMGPIVHETANQEISAVICRCMSPQARQLMATKLYELKPLPATRSAGLEILQTSRSLAEMLRLPPKF
jgi:hypothetical protein